MADVSGSSLYLRMTRISSYLPLMFLLSLTSSKTPDPRVCVPSGIIRPGPTPTLPDQYSTRVECNILDKNYTTDVQEFYDEPGNRGSIYQWEQGIKAVAIFSYKTGEYIMVLEDASNTPAGCLVKQLAQSDSKYLFGMTKTANGSEMIYSVGGALRFGRTLHETYLGVKRVRGILTDAFQSCVYVPDFNASALITWYFTAKNSWNTAVALNQVPVRCDVIGRTDVNSTYSYPFHHVYEFTDFRTNTVTDSQFELPKGAYCPNRKNTKALPVLTDFFHYYSEIIISEEQTIGFIYENYDFTTHLVKYEYYPQPGSQYGSHRLVEIHDYTTGVAYISDPMLGNCSYRSIEDTSLDAHKIDANHVRIRTSQEFFNFNNASYHYIGERTVRNIKCDVWTALRHDWPAGVTGVSSTFEWYFAQPQVTEEIGYSAVETKVPVMLEVTVKASQQNAHFIYNFYDYDEDQPMIWKFDISPCFTYLHRTNFQLAFPGQFRDVTKVNEDLFKYFLIIGIQGITSITPLRVSDIKIDYSQSDLIVTFTLLDVAPISGDVQGHKTEVALNTATSKLGTAVDSGTFSIQLTAPSLDSPVTMVAKPYSSSSWDTVINENTSKPQNGFSAGVMGGTAVAVVLVSFIIGFVILYIVYRVRGGSFSGPFKPQKFDDNMPVIT